MKAQSWRGGRPPGPRGHRFARTGQVPAAALVVALLVALAGCRVVTPTSQEPADARVEATLTPEQAEVVIKDYDTRRSTALTASMRRFDPVLWSTADTGMLHARNRIDTAIRGVEGNRRTAASTHVVRSVFAPAHETYPRLTIVDLDRTTGGRATSVVGAMTQQDEDSPWLMTSVATHTEVALPAPRGPGHAGTLTPATRSTLVARVGELVTQINAGNGPLVTGSLATEVEALAAPAGGRTEYRPWSPQRDQLAPRGSIHAAALPIEGGA